MRFVGLQEIKLAASGQPSRLGYSQSGGVFIGTVSVEAQQETPPPLPVIHQPVEDAWWTGPMLAPSAATLPRGHFLIEPYLFDVIAAHSNGFGSLTYVNYGLRRQTDGRAHPHGGFQQDKQRPEQLRASVSAMSRYKLNTG